MDVIVAAGFVAIDEASGQGLVVTESCACGVNGKLYQTAGWRENTARNKAMWEGRSWWRKKLGIAPKGWPNSTPHSDGASSIFGTVFGL